ncbi:uncharacterized protein CBL_07684 [Carabus blaptoides fortunei]
MFNEKTYQADGYDSTWRDEKESASASVQTTEFSVREQGTNTGKSVSIETQTDKLKEATVATNVDMNRLADFLKAVCPNMLNELNDARITNAMASVKISEDSSAVTASMLQELELANDNSNEKLFVSALSWNSTGNTLAVSGSYTHETWCYHEGNVHLYTFNRNNELPAMSTKILVCGACVTSVNFHPTVPSVLSAGTISGEIYIWNCQDDDKDGLIATLSAHDERITHVTWISNADPKKQSILLASSGLDAFLNLWDVNVDDSVVKLKQKYSVGRARSINAANSTTKSCVRGIVEFDFSPHVSGLFVVGLEGGAIVKCSLLGAKQLPVSEGDLVSIFDPSVSAFEKHEGEISTVTFSPHRNDIFLTCGSDNEIRIFNIDQITPVQIIFVEQTLHAVAWVPYQEKLVVGCGDNGCIKVFSMLNGQQIPNAASDNKTTLTQLALNKKRTDMAVFGNSNGQLQLWNFPWNNIAIHDSFKRL